MSLFSINTNVSSLIAMNSLNQTFSLQNNIFRQLSTGLRINRGFDGPAALMSSQSLLASLRVLDAESRALARSDSVINVADAALGEVSDLLVEAEALAVSSANTGAMSDAEREANQVELDSILQTVDRITRSTSFAGQSLFDGSVELSLSAGDTYSVPQVNSSDLGATNIEGTNYNLGDTASGQALNISTGDAGAAQEVIAAARDEISTLRGKLGAVSKFTIQPRIRTLDVAIQNTAAATSIIIDTDFARATSELTRLSILSSAGILTSNIANYNPTRVLGLLTPVSFGAGSFGSGFGSGFGFGLGLGGFGF